jgi:hypothetical protein
LKTGHYGKHGEHEEGKNGAQGRGVSFIINQILMM